MELEVAAAALAFSYWASGSLPGPGLHDLLVPGAMWRGPTETVSLTFDDGPHPVWTPRVLDRLRDHGARATFFVVGERAEAHPELVARIFEDGHDLGNHGFFHRSFLLSSSRRIASDIRRCQRVVASITGTEPRWFRPPYGRRDFRLYRTLKRLGISPVLWSLDSHDWLRRDTQAVKRRVSRARAGDIVLMHDGRPDCSATLDALDALLSRLARAGIPTGLLGTAA